MKLAAVIIETKTDLNYTANAIAQLMGYYLRACKKEADEHSVAILLTKSKVHLLLFPFTTGYVSCVNAVWLQSIEFSENNTLRVIAMLFLLTVITCGDFCSGNIKLEQRFVPVSKDHTFIIETEIEMMKNQLEHRLKEVEEEKKMLAREKMVVAAEKNEMMKLKAFQIAIEKLSEADIAAITGSFEKFSEITIKLLWFQLWKLNLGDAYFRDCVMRHWCHRGTCYYCCICVRNCCGGVMGRCGNIRRGDNVITATNWRGINWCTCIR